MLPEFHALFRTTKIRIKKTTAYNKTIATDFCLIVHPIWSLIMNQYEQVSLTFFTISNEFMFTEF